MRTYDTLQNATESRRRPFLRSVARENGRGVCWVGSGVAFRFYAILRPYFGNVKMGYIA